MSGWSGIDEFVAIANAGSFVRGAKALGASNAHMSRAIADLEARLQTQLFHRTTRSLRLTDTGRVFLQHCERIIMERDEAVALVSEKGEPQGELRITCSTALGERFIGPLAQRLAQAWPRLSISLDLSNHVMDLVAEGYDIAIRTGHLPDSRLVATRVATRRHFTCAAPEYLAQRGTPCTIEDLDNHDCLIGTSPIWHFTAGSQDRPYRPSGRWRSNNGHVVREAALAGMGICQLPDFYVLDALRAGRLVQVLDTQAPLDEPIWAVYPQRRHLLPKVRHFVELLRAELPGMVQRNG